VRPSGRKDRVIELYHRGSGVDVNGSPANTFTKYLTTFAEVIWLSGTEVLKLAQPVAEISARFIIHYNSGVLQSDKIVFQGKSWNIRAIKELGRSRELEIFAEVTDND
jgi:SPP1 family predicted phage head-tail adaptor